MAVNALACTLERAAELSGYSITRLYLAMKSGRLRTWKVGRRRMTKPKYLQEMIDRDEREGAGKAA